MTDGIIQCAEVHNEIVRLGQVNLVPFCTFWEKHPRHQAMMAESVSEDVVSFYKKALVPAGHISEEDPYQNLFYYLQGLACPWDGYNDFQLRKLNGEGISQKARYILLYTATKLSKTGQGGIMYDQFMGD